MDLSEKNVVLLLFPVSDLYVEYCLAEPGLVWPHLHRATLEEGPLMVNEPSAEMSPGCIGFH